MPALAFCSLRVRNVNFKGELLEERATSKGGWNEIFVSCRRLYVSRPQEE